MASSHSFNRYGLGPKNGLHGCTALIFAINRGSVEILKALLEAPGKDGVAIDLNQPTVASQASAMGGSLPLNMAVSRSSEAINSVTGNENGSVFTEIVKMLLGATGKDGVLCDVNKLDNTGHNALMVECTEIGGKIEIVNLLLGATDKDGVPRVDLNATCKGTNHEEFTALMFAAEQGYSDIVKALVCATGCDGTAADLNTANCRGYTPLLFAVAAGHIDCVTTLLGATGTAIFHARFINSGVG